MNITIETEMEKRNAEITEEILSGKAKLIDMFDYKTKDYIKCKGVQIEVIHGRTRLAFVRCPKCREYVSVYKDELKDEKGRTKFKKCLCGFGKTLKMIGWQER
jgi:formylmethanofuran dehydrogenase subunit E